MTFRITKSALKMLADRGLILDFEGEVGHHHDELNQHLVHHEAVKKQTPLASRPEWGDFAKEDDPSTAYTKAVVEWTAKRHLHLDPYPRPSAHPYIDAAVRFEGGRFIKDYEVVNDDPTPEQILRGKKNELLQKIGEAERAAVTTTELPPGKARLANLIENRIAIEDGNIAAGLAGTDPTFKDLSPDLQIAEVERRRSPEHTQHLKDQASRRAKVDAIVEASARAMSEVEDLTTETIDGFQVPDFK